MNLLFTKKLETKRKMTNIYKNVWELESFDIEDIEQPEVQENEVDDLLGDLNPRYFEEVIKLKDAKDMIFSSSIHNGFKFNISSVF